jgi:biotin transport system substrate-specific component
MTARAITLIDAVQPRARAASASAVRIGGVLFIAALTAAAAQVSVPLPFTQVPFTFQPMVVLLGGLALGARLGASAQVLYLLAGIAGLPVWAASASLPPGALRLLGPTGGYLMIYPLAAWITGTLAERGFARRYLLSVVAMAAGLVAIYAAGATWLAFFAQLGSQSVATGFTAALSTGVIPFIPADVIKLFLAAGIVPGLWSLFGRRAG